MLSFLYYVTGDVSWFLKNVVYAVLVFMYVHCVCVQYPQRTEGVRAPGIRPRVTDGFEPVLWVQVTKPKSFAKTWCLELSTEQFHEYYCSAAFYSRSSPCISSIASGVHLKVREKGPGTHSQLVHDGAGIQILRWP